MGKAEATGLGCGSGGKGNAGLRDDVGLECRWLGEAGAISQADGEHLRWKLMNLKYQLDIHPERMRCRNLHPGCLGQGGCLVFWTFRAGLLVPRGS